VLSRWTAHVEGLQHVVHIHHSVGGRQLSSVFVAHGKVRSLRSFAKASAKLWVLFVRAVYVVHYQIVNLGFLV